MPSSRKRQNADAIAPHPVNFHAEHHIFMHLPCWNLPRAHRLLAEKGVTERMEVAQGYGAVLAEASGRWPAESSVG